MVRCHLSRMMGERKMKIVDVAKETGLHRNTITLLYNETANLVDLETIGSLCKLFHCSVGYLFEFALRIPQGNKRHGGQWSIRNDGHAAMKYVGTASAHFGHEVVT